MKYFVLSSLALLASIIVTPVCAVPLDAFNEANLVSPGAQKVIDYLKNPAYQHDINPACFYSGYTMVNGKKVTAIEKLPQFQQQKHCHLLNEAVRKVGIDPDTFTHQDWRDTSKSLAENVSGTAYVLLGQVVEPGSVYITDEKEALAKNHKVTVEGWEIDSKGNVVHRGKAAL